MRSPRQHQPLISGLLAIGFAIFVQQAGAQEISVPSVTTADPGYLFPNDEHIRKRDPYLNPDERKRGSSQTNKTTSAASFPKCSSDALPASDRRRMQIEYVRRLRSDGKTKADIWVREQGKLFRQKLVAEGICPPLDAKQERAASATNAPRKDAVRDKSGKRCTKTRLEQRNIANLGGGAMQMIMVPVCVN